MRTRSHTYMYIIHIYIYYILYIYIILYILHIFTFNSDQLLSNSMRIAVQTLTLKPQTLTILSYQYS